MVGNTIIISILVPIFSQVLVLEIKLDKMKYIMFDVNSKYLKEELDQSINFLRGEVASVIPNLKPVFMTFGAPANLDFLLVVEKLS